MFVIKSIDFSVYLVINIKKKVIFFNVYYLKIWFISFREKCFLGYEIG